MELTCEQISAVFVDFDDSSVHTNLIHTAITSSTTTEQLPSLIDVVDHFRSCGHCQIVHPDLRVAMIGLRRAPDNRRRMIASRKQVRPSPPAPSVFERLLRSDPNFRSDRIPVHVDTACRPNAISSSADPSNTDYSGSTKHGSLLEQEKDLSDEDTPGNSQGTSPEPPDLNSSLEDILGVGERFLTQVDLPEKVVDVHCTDQIGEFDSTTVSNSGSDRLTRQLKQCDPKSKKQIGRLRTLLDTAASRNMIRADCAMVGGFQVDPAFKTPEAYCWGKSDQPVKVIGEYKVYAYDRETKKTMKIVADVVPEDEFTPGYEFIMSLKALKRTGPWCIQDGGIVVHFAPANNTMSTECQSQCCNAEVKNNNDTVLSAVCGCSSREPIRAWTV